MDLSNDLISQFVKITNDNSTGSKESTVYGTTVEYNGEMYVKIDGSDLLTPVETTTDIQPDERVTIMIKDHSATVTGNITSPSTNAVTVDKKVTEAVEGVEGKVITEVEILIADRVSTEQLDAEMARIDTLIAGKATIEQLEAIDAKIENLEVDNAVINELKAKDAEIENLVAENLKATNADIEILDAEVADIKTLVNGNLTSDNILSFHITADKVTMDDAFISDAMIANVSAGKITSGSINTSLVSVQSEDGALTINGSTQQFKDADGNVRIQIGKDATGDFTFALYGKDGQGQLINQNGITASAINDGLIVDKMVADNAAISGGKLDISSVITEINNDNSTTIKSNKIYLDEQNQSLEVAFKSLTSDLNNLSIGGNNLIRNSTFLEGAKAWGMVGKASVDSTSTPYPSVVVDESGNTSNTWAGPASYGSGATKINMHYGDVYVMSCYVYVRDTSSLDNGLGLSIKGKNTSGSDVEIQGVILNASDITPQKWTRITKVVQLQNEYTDCYIYGYVRRNGLAWFSRFQLEKGNVATEWRLSDADLEAELGSITEKVTSNTTEINVCKGNISTLVAEDEIIKKQVTDLNNTVVETEETLTAKYASLEQDVSGFKTSVADTYATKSTVNDLSKNLSTNYSTTSAMNSAIAQSASNITSSVSSTYATKESVTNLSNNLTTNYSTTTQMNSAISQSASNITSSVSSTYQKKSDMSNYPTTTQMNSAISQSASNITSTVSGTYATKSSLDSEVSALENSISTVEQTADKINWVVKSGTSSSNMTLTDRVYSLVSSNISLSADRIDLHGYVTANGGFSIDTSGNMTAVNGQFSGNITGSTFSSANDVFQVLNDGTINTDDIVINNSISASALNVDVINNNEYPKAMSRATNVYINQNATTVNDGEFVHNGVYSSIDALKAVAPRNLNGYNLAIYLSANYNGNIRLDNFHSGQINFNMQGYTVYGYMYFYGNSIVARVYGNMSTATGTGIMGSVMPYEGVVCSTYYYGIYFNYCTWSVTDVKLYADQVHTTNSGAIVCERCMGAVYNISAMGSGAMRYLVRAQYHSHVYVSSTSGLCNNATFVATTGSYIGFNESDTQAGTTSSSPTWTGSGGTIVKTGVTFEATANSGSNNNTGTTTTKSVTYTGTANTYRSNVYTGWKNDNTARQGDWGYGDCTGCWFFGDSFDNIASKNVTKVVITFSRQSGGYTAAVSHTLYTHKHESKPSGAPTLNTSIGSVSVAVGGTGTLTITNATTISAIKSAKGIAIRDTAYSAAKYSVCSSGMKVTFYYTE